MRAALGVPGEHVFEAEVPAGLVLWHQHVDHLELWDQNATRVLRPLATTGNRPHVVDTYGNTVAWTCDLPCGLHLTDAETGQDRLVSPPPGKAVDDTGLAAFSPDGSLLAVLWEVRRGPQPRAHVLALVDVAQATSKLVPGPDADVFTPCGLAWSPSGRWLFHSSGRGTMLSGYRIGDASAFAIRRTSTPGTFACLAVP